MSNPPRFVDVTLPVSESLPPWPGDAAVTIERFEGVAAVSALRMSSHIGTHVDAPAHFFPYGESVDRLPLDALIGPAWVARIPEAAVVTAAQLARAGVPAGVERLIVATDNTAAPKPADGFNRDFVAFDESAVEWLLARRLRLVGIDGPSVDPFGSEGFFAHKQLLTAAVVIVENLALADVAAGAYRLLCLPLRFEGGDGAPARVVLERI